MSNSKQYDSLTAKLRDLVEKFGPENFDQEEGEFFVVVIGKIDDVGVKRVMCSNLKSEALSLVLTPPDASSVAGITAFEKRPDGSIGERLSPEDEAKLLKEERALARKAQAKPIADILEAMIKSGALDGPVDKSKLN